MEKLLKKLVSGFDEEIFKNLLKKKLKNFEEEEREIWLPEGFPDYYTPRQVGTAILDNYKIGIYTVRVEKELTERSSKKEQFNVAKVLINEFSQDAGLFAFYDKEGKFRLSLVFKEYLGSKAIFSNYKRFTFFVKPQKPNRTFIKRFLEIEWNSFRDLIDTFSVEPLSEEFYKEIQSWFYWAKDKIKFPSGEPEHHLIRLLSRLIFVWFLKEKSLIPEDIFNEGKLKSMVRDFGKSTNYYNAILQNLFFATLNQEIDKRRFAKEGNFLEERKEFDVKNLYRYKDFLLISEEEFINLFKNTPFINGGLFECLDREKNYIDGFSRNPKRRALIPDEVFFSEEKTVNLGKYGLGKRKVRGLIKILSSYDWTAEESTPLDVEVALDPELLGKVFENILAEINPETQEDARRQTGSYYTPKEIVNYMVEESLLYLLKERTGIEEEKLKKLIYEEESPFTEEEKRKIVKTIANLKVIDPACGSGAFLVGILLKLIKLLDVVDPNNTVWKEIQKEILTKRFEKILNEEDFKGKLRELEEDFDLTKNYPDFARKLYIIQNSLYGVDIQPVAIELTKLRFFITLLVDQKTDKKAYNFGIKPLPNLDLNFVCADALVKLDYQKSLAHQNPNIQELENKIKELSRSYFRASTYQKKKRIEKEIKHLRKQLVEELKNVGFPSSIAQKIADFDPFDPLKVNYWFDPEWIFEIRSFDLVISNPPYIRQERLKRIKRNGKSYKEILKEQNYKTFSGTADIYVCFYERGTEILSQGGILTFISSNKFMRANYGEKLRKFLSDYKILEVVDFGGFRVFGATVDTAIVIVQRRRADNNHKVLAVSVPSDIDREKLIDFLRKNKIEIPQKYFKNDAWIIEDVKILKLKEKIEKAGTPLKDWKGINIFRGVLTGFNDAFVVDTETKERILKNCRSEEERKRTEKLFKKVLRGRDIGRYYYRWAGKWLIATFPSLKLNIDDYPALRDYLASFGKRLEQSGKIYKDPKTGERIKARKKTPHKWFETQDTIAYWEEFEKPKIVWNHVSGRYVFAYVPEEFYLTNALFMIVHKFENINELKYILGVLNSVFADILLILFTNLSTLGKYAYGAKDKIERLPIPRNPDPKLKQEIIKRVDEILRITSREDYPENKELEKKVEEISKEIDELVYKLYGLDEEEIKLVEERIKN